MASRHGWGNDRARVEPAAELSQTMAPVTPGADTASLPLCVDLDGTLLPIDTLHEALAVVTPGLATMQLLYGHFLRQSVIAKNLAAYALGGPEI